MQIENNYGNRIIEYDILRLIAIFAVILVHCVSPFVNNCATSDIRFVIANTIDSFSRIAVPFFLMISGIFMLDENRDLNVKKIKHKIFKLFIILILWSLYYDFVSNYNVVNYNNLFHFYHLWYLYVIIGLYLITPILRLFLKKDDVLYVYYFLALCLIFQFLPMSINALFPNNIISPFFGYFKLNFVCGFVAYYIVGWLINVDYEKYKKYIKYLIIISIISVIFIVVLSQIQTTPQYRAYIYFYEEQGLFVFLYSVPLFICLKLLFEKLNVKLSENIKGIIIQLSNLCLGVYIVHIMVLKFLNCLIRAYSIGNFPLQIVITFFGTILLSFFICYLISKVSYIKEIIKI